MTETAYTALDLSRLIRLYAALSPATPSKITSPPFPTVEYLARSCHQTELFDLLTQLDRLNEKHISSNPNGCRWKYAFWKRVIQVIERIQVEGTFPGIEYPPSKEAHSWSKFWCSNLTSALCTPLQKDEEIDSRILLHYISLQRGLAPEDMTGTEIRRYFYGSLSDRSAWQCVVLKEDKACISKGNTGLRSWGASVCLANYLISNPSVLENRRVVIELGSGTGLVGILAHQLSLSRNRAVYLTDVNPLVLERLTQNVELNAPACDSLLVRSLDWNLPTNWEEFQADLVLAADVVYDPTLASPLAKTFRLLLSGPGKPRGLLSVIIRQEQTWELFLSYCQSESLHVRTLPHPILEDDNGIIALESLDQPCVTQIQLVEVSLSA